ncbi:uncharacterized protein NKAPD1 [Megalops cyprinoides]|uniref:uncharacterized protein NKAPD1 n=1 Tax=Megalops cyprinoides TaxID=118141 RepID=UPI001863BC1F|nr:uncharacterized protein NKAPD1 [Megalops cyprinoides]
MSREPMGKVLLRNVIRHTDAHNKIQEESEMWKLRDMERQAPAQTAFHKRTPAHMHRGHMHCDRFLEETSVSARDRTDEREARYWTRKLYEFEASDPDRWGHSGFKELYPEEFELDSEKEGSDGENHRRKKGKAGLEADRHKRSKKSSRKKKKKKKEKKKRKAEEAAEERSGSEGDSDRRRRRKKSGKSKHRRKKRERERGRKVESSSEDSDSAGRDLPRKRHRKPERDGEAQDQAEPHRKKRKNWKATNEENSEESSED